VEVLGLGHGYCSSDFFEQCPHRMACAKCSLYIPKESTAAALLEGKSNLLPIRREIPLTDAEIAALDDGVSALESLLSRLENIPYAIWHDTTSTSRRIVRAGRGNLSV
jgi:hypothetical protein